jgi:predicted nucleic acid-binding protein
MLLLVDSTVWIDYFNGQITPQTDYLDHVLSDEIVLVGDLILAEVLQGYRSDAEFERALRVLNRFTQTSLGTPSLAVQSARNYRQLRVLGITVRKTIDCLIATYCIENGHSLLHNDSDFDGFERRLGLSVIHP